MNRRTFLAVSASVPFVSGARSVAIEPRAAIPIIDTHIHLFDTNRPQGVPWPSKENKVLFKPALPARYRSIAGNLCVAGAIVVEASPWTEDNQWVLDVAAHDNIIVGVIGNLEPGKPDFGRLLERFQASSLFRGIRYGNLWGRDLAGQLHDPAFISDLKLLARNGLVLDTANPNPALIAAIVKLTNLVPDLTVIIDHLPQMDLPDDKAIQSAYMVHLRELAQRPQVYLKISAVFRKVNGRVVTELDFYRDRLDLLYTTFGEDRLLYGSDWPNSDNWRPFEDGLNLVRTYFKEKGQIASEKYFWKNSIAAYNWKKRDAAQPGLG
jgi:L-fuconolactonase